MRPDDSVYLQHILDAIERVEVYLIGVDEERFWDEPMVQDAVIRQMEIIGEASRRVSEETRVRNPKIPWQDMAGMRNKLIHDYFGVDVGTVWLTATGDLPELASEIEQLIRTPDDPMST
jgi:uncharacterized protein with HEPN domain